MTQKTAADFFAGIGLVSLGLQRGGWETTYALDYDAEKELAYVNHFGGGHYYKEDIAKVKGSTIPSVLLAHASFPCTDLSVAGGRKGIHHGESSAFWEFARVLSEMKKKHGEGKPPLVLLENVEGLLTSNQGKDLELVLRSLNEMNYRVDLLRVDASHFVPQSRVRIFVIGIHDHLARKLVGEVFSQERNLQTSNARPTKIIQYIARYPGIKWYFHDLPNLPTRQITLDDIVDKSESWWTGEKTQYLYNQMHARHQDVLQEKLYDDNYSYFTSFRRMRIRDGKSQSTAELRLDGIAGCLRTPKGGSARQILVRVGRGKIDARLINGKEAAHLMGAFDFKLNTSFGLNQILFGFGDAVCVPAVEWITNNYLNEVAERV